jgi:hypothetical protein
MARFRTHWLALLGGALLLALSVSSAFGAKPVGDDPNRGQQVSTFVHELVFGNEEPEEQPDEEEVDEDEVVETDEEVVDEDEVVETDEEVVDEEPVTGAEHGACVAAVAQDPELVDGDNENHGGAVSLAARFTCWGLEPPTEEPTGEEPTGDELTTTEADATEAAVKDRGKSAAAHEKAKENRGRGHGEGGRH